MNIEFIIIVLGEPYSTFSEILGKYFSKINKFEKKIILIGNKKLLKTQLKKLNYNLNFNEINKYEEAKKNLLNIIDIKFKYRRAFTKISTKSNNYIENCFSKSLEIINSQKNKCILINGPVSKKAFLKKKYSGITEYLSRKTNSKNEIMLIYNNKFSVSPLTTHIPIKLVNNYIKKDKIYKNISSLKKFYTKTLKQQFRCAILGLNPHCETTDNFSEEEKIIIPSIKYLRKNGIKVDGPFAADTFFLESNLKKYNIVIGMYHDQVLTPIKTLFKFNAINLTIGLPFLRISPDHGPNSNMLGKNLSDPSSFFYAMNFANKIR